MEQDNGINVDLGKSVFKEIEEEQEKEKERLAKELYTKLIGLASQKDLLSEDIYKQMVKMANDEYQEAIKKLTSTVEEKRNNIDYREYYIKSAQERKERLNAARERINQESLMRENEKKRQNKINELTNERDNLVSDFKNKAFNYLSSLEHEVYEKPGQKYPTVKRVYSDRYLDSLSIYELLDLAYAHTRDEEYLKVLDYVEKYNNDLIDLKSGKEEKEEIKGEVKEETKEDVKEEIEDEVKVETKEDVKEEIENEVKAETKEDVKEEKQEENKELDNKDNEALNEEELTKDNFFIEDSQEEDNAKIDDKDKEETPDKLAEYENVSNFLNVPSYLKVPIGESEKYRFKIFLKDGNYGILDYKDDVLIPNNCVTSKEAYDKAIDYFSKKLSKDEVIKEETKEDKKVEPVEEKEEVKEDKEEKKEEDKNIDDILKSHFDTVEDGEKKDLNQILKEKSKELKSKVQDKIKASNRPKAIKNVGEITWRQRVRNFVDKIIISGLTPFLELKVGENGWYVEAVGDNFAAIPKPNNVSKDNAAIEKGGRYL